jgi:hypothetical protein
MIISNFSPSVSPDTKRENSSKEAISVVHALKGLPHFLDFCF